MASASVGLHPGTGHSGLGCGHGFPQAGRPFLGRRGPASSPTASVRWARWGPCTTDPEDPGKQANHTDWPRGARVQSQQRRMAQPEWRQAGSQGAQGTGHSSSGVSGTALALLLTPLPHSVHPAHLEVALKLAAGGGVHGRGSTGHRPEITEEPCQAAGPWPHCVQTLPVSLTGWMKPEAPEEPPRPPPVCPHWPRVSDGASNAREAPAPQDQPPPVPGTLSPILVPGGEVWPWRSMQGSGRGSGGARACRAPFSREPEHQPGARRAGVPWAGRWGPRRNSFQEKTGLKSWEADSKASTHLILF